MGDSQIPATWGEICILGWCFLKCLCLERRPQIQTPQVSEMLPSVTALNHVDCRRLKLKNGWKGKMVNVFLCIYICTQSIKYRLSCDPSLSLYTTWFWWPCVHLLSFLFSLWFTLLCHLCFICLQNTIHRTPRKTTLLNSIQCVFWDTWILNTGTDYSEGKFIYGYNTLKCPDYTLELF